MISAEKNERLTRVGPGTPGGELLRRYWQPIAASSEVREVGTRTVRLLGEDLVLFRDPSGSLGLIAERCPHRGCSLAFGIPSDRGISCPYHGWLFDTTGQCIEQPAEPETSMFKDRVQTPAYPVQEMGGLVWTYLGPDPAPLLPRFDLFARPNVLRSIGFTMLPCNWVQVMENSVDPVHFEYLHGVFGDYNLSQTDEPPTVGPGMHHTKIGFDEFEFGIIKRRVVETTTEDDDAWKIGHPVVFPNMLKVGRDRWWQFQIRVPVDDTHTLLWWYSTVDSGSVPVDQPLDEIESFEVPYQDEDGRPLVTEFAAQDMMAWVSQGPIADRTVERLTTSDIGVTTFRRILLREMDAVAQGQDPLGTLRDTARRDEIIDLPQEGKHYFQNAESAALDVLRQPGTKYSPLKDQFIELYCAPEPSTLTTSPRS